METRLDRRPAGCAGIASGMALLLAVSALCLGVAELTLRWLRPDEIFYVWPPHLSRTFQPATDVIGGVVGPSRFDTSSIGLRSDEIPRESGARVLAIGGSTTECLLLDQDEAWPQRLQELLENQGVASPWVGNAGRSGHDSEDHLTQVQHLLPQVPSVDTVLVLAGVNDLTAALRHADQAAERQASGADMSRFRRAFAITPMALEPVLYKRTALYATMRTLKDVAVAQVLGGTFVDDAGRIYETWRQHRRQAVEIRGALPDLTRSLARFRANLEAVVQLSRQQGAQPILMTQPSLWRVDLTSTEENLLWLGGVGDFQAEPGHSYYAASALAAGMRAYNDVTRTVCRDLGVVCIDLAQAVSRTPANFYDDVHFTEDGAELVASEVAGRILGMTTARAPGPVASF